MGVASEARWLGEREDTLRVLVAKGLANVAEPVFQPWCPFMPVARYYAATRGQ